MHIEIDEISKQFGTTAALHPVSQSLPSGALVSVHAVNAARASDDERLADWYDKVWLSFDPASVLLLTD